MNNTNVMNVVNTQAITKENMNMNTNALVVNATIAQCNEVCDTLDNMFVNARYMMKQVGHQVFFIGTLKDQHINDIKYWMEIAMAESYNAGGLMYDYAQEPEQYMGEFSEYYDQLRAETCTMHLYSEDHAANSPAIPF